MGPQTGYFAPQLLVEQSLSGPGIQARGVAFAGTNLFVQLGRGTRLRVVGDQREQRQRRHRRGAAVQRRRLEAHRALDGLPRGQEVPPDAEQHPLGDHDTQRDVARPADDLRLPGAAHPARDRAAAHDRRQGAGRDRLAALDLRPRGRLGHRLRSAQRPRLRPGRRRVPAGDEQHRLHVQLVLRRRPRHLLLLLGPAAAALGEGRARPAALGGQALRLEGLARLRRPPARDQPRPRLLRVVEQQAGARLRRGRQHLVLRPGLPLAGARGPAQGGHRGRPTRRPGRA